MSNGCRPSVQKCTLDRCLLQMLSPPCYVKIQKSRNSPSHVIHVDKLNVSPGETPKSWLAVDMDDDTVVAFKDERDDGKPQDDGVI